MSKFKIGDKVRIIAHKYGHKHKIGDELYLVSSGHNPERGTSKTKGGAHIMGGYVADDIIELIEESRETIGVEDIKEGVIYNMIDNYGKTRKIKLNNRTLINLEGGADSNIHNAKRNNYKFKKIENIETKSDSDKIKDLESRLEKAREEYREYTKKIKELETIKDSIPELEKKAVDRYIKDEKKILLKAKKEITHNNKSKVWDSVVIDDLTYRKLELSFKTKMPLLLKGPAGVGKSTFIKTLAEEKGVDIVQYNFNGDTTVEHLLGHKILVGGDMLWEDGPLTDAVRNGKIFLADEINASSAEIQFILNGLLELKNGKLGKLSVQGNNGEIIDAHPNFRFFGTYNPGYLGTKNFGTSIMSRFIGVDIKPLDKDKEANYLRNLYPDYSKEIELLVELEKLLRDNKNFSYDISTRDLIQTLMFIDGGFSLKEAIDATIVNSCQIDLDVSELKDTLQNIIS